MMAAANFAHFYETLPQAYNYSHDYQVASMHRARIDVFRGLMPPVAGKRVLDAGCSAGGYLAVARLMGASLAVGVDLDTDALRRSHVWNSTHDLGTNVASADVAQLPFRERSFDIVICSEVLEHVSDPQPVMSELVRVLRPGGWAAISLPNVVSYHWGLERRILRTIGRAVLRRAPLDRDYLQHMEFPVWRTLRMVRDSGLKIEKVAGPNCLPLNRTHVMPQLSRAWPGLANSLERLDVSVSQQWPFYYCGSVIFVLARKA